MIQGCNGSTQLLAQKLFWRGHMLVTSCLANKALTMQQLLHLESPQEMHLFNLGVSFWPRP